MSTGAGSSQSSSRPLSGPERAEVFSNAMQQLASAAPSAVSSYTGPDGKTAYSLNAPTYSSPQFQSSGAAKTLTNGDYDALQQSMTEGYTAPLDYAKSKDLANFNNSAGAKGIWSSGLAVKGENDIATGYAPQYAQAGANATNARYGMQNQENQMVNSYNQQEAGSKNTFLANDAQQTYNSAWAPLNYLQGTWNGTGGTISNGGSSNWSI